MAHTLIEAALTVLGCAVAADKAALSRTYAAAWRAGRLVLPDAPGPHPSMPDTPSRPSSPEPRPPREMPRRRFGSLTGRQALLHAVAHIELNAIDLAWDLIGRFACPTRPRAFFDDWVRVADDEARHFGLLCARLSALGSQYGALPVHAGMWDSAYRTRHDLLARLAVVPLVLEARGLDVAPAMITGLTQANDEESARLLALILNEEIGHVATGWRWFSRFCEEAALSPEETWRTLVRSHYGALRGPSNQSARAQAGLPAGLSLIEA